MRANDRNANVSILSSTYERKERASPAECFASCSPPGSRSCLPLWTLHREMDSPFILSRTIPDIPDIATPRYSWRRAGACSRRLALRSLLRCFLPVHTDSSDTWMVSKGTSARYYRGWTRGKHTHVRRT